MLTISQKKFCADGKIDGKFGMNMYVMRHSLVPRLLSMHGKPGNKPKATIYMHYFLFSTVGFESVLWHVPVTIATSKNRTAVKFVLDKCSDTVTVEGVGPNDWILVSNLHVYLNSHNVHNTVHIPSSHLLTPWRTKKYLLPHELLFFDVGIRRV